jgi:DivIVA domain-containing protein
MQTVILILAILVAGGAIFWGIKGSKAPRENAETIHSNTWLVGLHEPTPNLPPTLLPEHPRAEDLQQLKLPVGLRGYRADHVDAVIDTLTQEIERLHGVLEERDKPAVISATDTSGG